MRTLNALFVGIDDYPGEPLRGCVNDVREAETWLRRQRHVASDIRRLHNGDATLAAVRAGIEQHLGRSGPGDTALLWFSGHGTEEPTDAPWEGTGRSQALVCHDSLGDGRRPLWDTELGALLDGIAARGAHVVAVLDCCHSGGATRAGATVRAVTWRPWWSRTAPGDGTPGARGRCRAGTACSPPAGRRSAPMRTSSTGRRAATSVTPCWRRSASWAPRPRTAACTRSPGNACAGSPPAASRAARRRGPALPVRRPGAGLPFLLRHTAAGWEVDCGEAHGLRAAGAEFTLLDGDGTPRTVVVREVRTESALVDPVDWRPRPADRDAVFGVTPSALAFPPAAVRLTGDPGVVRLVEAAVAGAPMLSTATATTGSVPLRVDAGPGLARVSGGAGRELPPLPVRSPPTRTASSTA
ncbi:hypothetical protein SHKM778_56860 [Streptomyces sp. KM77-8]|uniref:Peptidase C14 caspase domain-containing protein n=1 Tax=Streptomyces haneummycinicus TaxID=3074435 RepID=A0AAT9HPK9_9ACTN